MQQAKIRSFFKPCHPKTHDPPHLSDQIDAWELSGNTNLKTPVTYKRRDSDPDSRSDDDVEGKRQLNNKEMGERSDGSANPSLRSNSVGKILNKKRSYAQYHLEFGQSDFLLHTCSVCGLMYARGDVEDEKVHKAFHKDYYQGIQFKGWCNERVVYKLSGNGNRIVLVLDGDPPAQKQKVRQIAKMMEKDLGFSDDRLIHMLCKVYLFISSHRVVGCLVAEPIRTAHRVITSPSSYKSTDTKFVLPKMEVADNNSKRLNPAILQFGNFSFQREVSKKGCSTISPKVNQWDSGAIFCEEEAFPAICGIRAIWVAPSSRRKRIASQLLDAARKSFFAGQMLETAQCAFSPPTSSGKAFAISYSRTESFLVYREDDI